MGRPSIQLTRSGFELRPRLPELYRIHHFRLPRVRRSFGFYVRGNWYHEFEVAGGRVLHVPRRGDAGAGRRACLRRDPYWRASLSWPSKEKD